MKSMQKILGFVVMLIAVVTVLSACNVTTTTTNTNSNANVDDNSGVVTTTTTGVKKYYLSGTELERVEGMLEGSWSGVVSGNRVEYVFKNGTFEAYAEIGGKIITNQGTYRVTNVDIELSFQNGSSKVFTYQINGNELAMQLQ